MPYYTYRNKETGEEIDIFQHMNDVHEYHGENNDEDCWDRVFHPVLPSASWQIDPNDGKAFVEKTANQKGTMGDLLEQSAELSEKRSEQNGGVDPLKEQYFKRYSEERGGAKHKDELKKGFENDKVKVEWD
jgi:hypothetical protein